MWKHRTPYVRGDPLECRRVLLKTGCRVSRQLAISVDLFEEPQRAMVAIVYSHHERDARGR